MALAPVRIVTDSAADLTPELAAELGVEVVPLSIRFGSEELADGPGIGAAEFYRKMATSPSLPETAAPSPGAFAAAFRRALDTGAEHVVCIDLSSDLSGTMQSALVAAKELPEGTVRVVDSRSVTWGLGSQVVAAARAAAAGASADEVVALVEDMRSRTRVYGALDTLDNLRKGGRVGNARALMGALLSIKPIIDLSSGVTEEAGKARTRGRSLTVLRDKVAAAGTVENLAVMHGQAPDVDQLVELLAEIHPREDIHVGIIGPTVGVHGGQAVMGVTFQVVE